MIDNQPTPDENRQRDLQRTQLKMDLVKHVSTLSSGAIVILATFLNKSTTGVVDSHWLRASVVSLITSLISSLIYFWTFGLARQWKRPNRPAYADPVEKITGLLVASGFCAGILCLGVFVIKNSK
jgi:hypothetical protein